MFPKHSSVGCDWSFGTEPTNGNYSREKAPSRAHMIRNETTRIFNKRQFYIDHSNMDHNWQTGERATLITNTMRRSILG